MNSTATVLRREELSTISSKLENGTWCAVMAPRFSGKSTLAKQLADTLKVGHPSWRTVHVHFERCGTLAQAWKHMNEAVWGGSAHAETTRHPASNLDVFVEAASRIDEKALCLLLDGLDRLPDEVLRLMGNDLRRLKNQQNYAYDRERIHIVFFGAMKLFYLTADPLSPLMGVVDSIDLLDLNQEESVELFTRLLESPGLEAAARTVLYDETAGHPYLVRELAGRCAEAGFETHSIRSAAEEWSLNAARYPVFEDPCFSEIKASLDNHKRAFSAARSLLDEPEVPTPWAGIGDVAPMSGALSVEGKHLRFRGKMIERALRHYLTDARKADYCCLHGDWEEAKRYYRAAGPANVRSLREKTGEGAGVVDLFLGLVKAGGRFRRVEDAEEFVKASAQFIFGADSAALRRFDPEYFRAARIGVPDSGDDLPAAAARNCAAFTLAENGGIVQGIGNDPERPRWALQLQYSEGLPERWVRPNLSRCEPTLYQVLNLARRAQAEVDREQTQQQLMHDIALSVQAATTTKEVLDLVVKSVTTGLGYECAQLALVFPQERMIRGVASTGKFDRIVGDTVRPLNGPDVLAKVIDERAPRIVPDCSAPDCSCAADAISKAGIKSQVVLPLLDRTKAIGTLQVGNTERTGAFGPRDQDLLQLFADTAAIAIGKARERDNLELTLQTIGDAVVVVDSGHRILSQNDAYTQIFSKAVGDPAPLTPIPEESNLLMASFERSERVETLAIINGRRFIVAAAARKDEFGRYAGGVEVIDSRNPLMDLTGALEELLAANSEDVTGRVIVETLRRVFGDCRVRVYRADSDGLRLVSRWSKGMSVEAERLFKDAHFTFDRHLDDRVGDGLECLREGKPLIVIREQVAQTGLPQGEITLDSQHRRVLALPDSAFKYLEELEKDDVKEWVDLPLGDMTFPLGKVSLDYRGSSKAFRLEDLEMLSLIGKFASDSLRRTIELDRSRAAATTASDLAYLVEGGSLEDAVWHFLLHITMHGGPGANRAGLFIRQPHAEELAGFLCHGAANPSAFTEAITVGKLGNREELIKSLAKERLAGEMSEQEKTVLDRFRALRVAKNADGNAFSRAFAERRVIYERYAASDLAGFYHQLGWSKARDALIIPLMFSGECEGLLYVDKAFLTEGVGNRDDQRGLEAQCIPLAGALHTSRLAAELRHQIIGLTHTSLAPFNAIHGLAEELKDRLCDPKLGQMASLIHAQARVGSDTFRRVLLMAKRASGEFRLEMKPTDLKAVLEKSLQPYAMLAECEGVKVEWQLPIGPAMADADEQYLALIFSELGANASQALKSAGGTAKLLRVTLSFLSDANGWDASVENTGRLIPVEFRESVFNRFESRTGGTGIGLWLVREIANLHGGKVWYEVSRERNSMFTVRLPRRGA